MDETPTTQQPGCGCSPLALALLSAIFSVVGLVVVHAGGGGRLSGLGLLMALVAPLPALLSLLVALNAFLAEAMPWRATWISLLISGATLILTALAFATGLLDLDWLNA